MKRHEVRHKFVEEVLLTSAEGAYGFSLYPVGEDLEGENSFKEEYREVALLPEQTHTCNVGVVTSPARSPLHPTGRRFPDTDALISFDPAVTVGVVTADCVPILLYAPDIKAVAAIHAGWKGTLGGIVDNTLDILLEHGANPALMKAVFGASISLPLYEVDRNLADRFSEAGFAPHVRVYDSGKPHIDLQGVNRERLLRRGLDKGNITTHPGCTFSSCNRDGNPVYPSHRRSKGSPVRMLTAIRLQA